MSAPRFDPSEAKALIAEGRAYKKGDGLPGYGTGLLLRLSRALEEAITAIEGPEDGAGEVEFETPRVVFVKPPKVGHAAGCIGAIEHLSRCPTYELPPRSDAVQRGHIAPLTPEYTYAQQCRVASNLENECAQRKHDHSEHSNGCPFARGAKMLRRLATRAPSVVSGEGPPWRGYDRGDGLHAPSESAPSLQPCTRCGANDLVPGTMACGTCRMDRSNDS